MINIYTSKSLSSNSPSSLSLSSELGGSTKVPMCSRVTSSTREASVGCSLTSLDTQKVKKKGRPYID